MEQERRRTTHTHETTTILILGIIAFALVCPVSATGSPISALPWVEDPPAGDAKAPVPVEAWQLPPLTIILVLASLYVPACLVSLEALVFCGGALTLNFRRIRKRSALDNVCRSRIHSYIVNNPGAAFSEIERGVPVNRGTLAYHLGVLHRECLVVAVCHNNRAFYFENAGKYPDGEMDAMVRLKNEKTLYICRLLSRSPGVSQTEIARQMKVTTSTASWHLQRLNDANLVSIGKEGRQVRYRLTPFAAETLKKAVQGSGK